MDWQRRFRREDGWRGARAGFAFQIGFLAVGSLLLGGCPSPNSYTTPRTIGSGQVQGSAAIEAGGFYIPALSSADYTLPAQSDISLVPPTFGLRVGLGDRWEIGAHVGHTSSLGADLKWNFLRSSRIDLAIDPAFHVSPALGYVTAGTLTYLEAPLLVGVNLSRTVSLVLSPGVSWVSISNDLRIKIGNETSASAGPLERLGFGADFRITRRFALHPEITFLRGLGSDDTIIYMAGLGLNFGDMPNYDDVGGGPPAAPAPPPAM